MSELGLRLVSALGLLALVGVAWLFSLHRRLFPWRVVGIGIAAQLLLGLALLRTDAGRAFFVAVNAGVVGLLGFTQAGTRFVFGPLLDAGPSFVLGVLPIIIFMGALFSVLYHLGIVQRLVGWMAILLTRSLGSSGAESLAAVANIFVGMAEAPLLVRPYLEHMTRSELFTVMNTGMATVAGSVLLAYVQMLGGGDFAGHLVTASLLSAPAGVLIAKVLVPETETARTAGAAGAATPRTSANLIDAASMGALAGLRIAAYVGALVLAFVALVHLLNAGVGAAGALVGMPDLTFQRVLGLLLAPAVWLMGIPWEDAAQVGALMGVKTVLNEFLAYAQLGDLIRAGAISQRTAIITSYALCGFANFGSLAILLGAIGSMAPSRRADVASLGLRSILGGTLATMMTGCIAGLVL